MTDNRKSSRARKAVSYSSFEAEDDSDDDFAGSNPPPSKRTKLERKERSAKDDRTKDRTLSTKKRQDKERNRPVTLTDSQSDSTGATRSGKERVSLDNKVFDHEMQVALELSMHESQTDEQSTDRQTAGRKEDIQAQIHTTDSRTESPSVDKLSDKISETDNKENVALAKKPFRPAASVSEPSDEIILVETVHGDEVEGGRGRRRAAARQAVARQREMAGEESDEGEEEGEFQAHSSDNSSSDENDAVDSEYEEFAASSKKRKPGGKINKGKSPKSAGRGKKKEAGGRTRKASDDKKAKTTPRTAQNKSSAPNPTTPVTPLVRRPQVGGPGMGFTPPTVTGGIKTNFQDASQKLTPPIARKHVWSSPSSSSESNPLGGVKLVSPGQPIRLGLSRNVRIKPLHPGAKVL